MCTISTTMAVKLKKVALKLLTEYTKSVGTGSRGHTSLARQETLGMVAYEHVNLQATLTREYMSTQGIVTRQERKH